MPVPDRHHFLRSAHRVSAISAAWSIAASTAAVVIGLLDDSVALVAFGAVGLFDCAASLVLVAHFRAARVGDDAEHLERIAVHVITAGLLAVGLATAAVSVTRLIDGSATHAAEAGVALAAASSITLTALAWWKRHVSLLLPSRALRADGQLTTVGAVLAVITLTGTAASNELGWWWADPATALLIAVGAVAVGILLHAGPPERTYFWGSGRG